MDKMIEAIAQAVLTVLMCAVLLYACNTGLQRQAEADYQKCLLWQADGYPIRCDSLEPKE